MPKLYLLLLALLCLFALNACAATDTGGGDTAAEGAVFAGKVAAVMGDSVLLIGQGEAADDGLLYLLPLSGLTITDDSGGIDAAAVTAGALVEISYGGIIQESYPAGFGAATALKVTGREDNLAGFYLAVLRDLYAVDPGLNDGITMLAFDLREATNLNAAEKAALLYLAAAEFGLETVSATYDELCEQGLIDRENVYFPTGLLIVFTVSEAGEDSFTFTAQKWRSGLGAYWFADCLARRSGNDWGYTVGSEAIS